MTRIIHPDTEVTIHALARRLGAELPVFSRASRPELWQCWADRIMQAGSQADRGQNPAEAIADAERYNGRPSLPQGWPAALPN